MVNHLVPFLGQEVEDALDKLAEQLMEIESELANKDDLHLRKLARLARKKMRALLQGKEVKKKKGGGWRMSYERELELIREQQREHAEQCAMCERMVNTRVLIIEKEGKDQEEVTTEADIIQVIGSQVLLRRVWPQEFMLMDVRTFVEKFEDNEIHISVLE